jgi:hypothetical protein
VEPIHQHAIWQRVGDRPTPERVAAAIDDAEKSGPRRHLEGGSWTNDRSWVQGYEGVLDPMNRLSAQFHAVVDDRPVDKRSRAYRNALFHLLVTQTSCYRYWGTGRWTDTARELCRRGSEILAGIDEITG